MTNPSSSSHALPTLYEEHLLLGATFGNDATVEAYPSTASHTSRDLARGAFLCDVSHVPALLFSGEPAPSFAHAAFAGANLAVGSCAFEAVLTGDGSVASIPLLARTGEREYVAWDPSPRAEVLEAWLSFLSSVSQDGYAPYEGMTTDDATGSHVMLVLGGDEATRVLDDYLGTQRAPRVGEVCSLLLDELPCIVVRVPHACACPCYLVLVPPAQSRALWRSLLSFTEVTPIGTRQLGELVERALPQAASLATTDALRVPARELAQWEVLRPGMDYVGARGLTAAP